MDNNDLVALKAANSQLSAAIGRQQELFAILKSEKAELLEACKRMMKSGHYVAFAAAIKKAESTEGGGG